MWCLGAESTTPSKSLFYIIFQYLLQTGYPRPYRRYLGECGFLELVATRVLVPTEHGVKLLESSESMIWHGLSSLDTGLPCCEVPYVASRSR